MEKGWLKGVHRDVADINQKLCLVNYFVHLPANIIVLSPWKIKRQIPASQHNRNGYSSFKISCNDHLSLLCHLL